MPRVCQGTDGSRCSWPHSCGPTWDLYGIKPDGAGLRSITNVGMGERLIAPRWSPDGTRLTAYDFVAGGGILVDLTSGTFEPFVTTRNFTRPLIRPLP